MDMKVDELGGHGRPILAAGRDDTEMENPLVPLQVMLPRFSASTKPERAIRRANAGLRW
jgi:hypothetical protein